MKLSLAFLTSAGVEFLLTRCTCTDFVSLQVFLADFEGFCGFVYNAYMSDSLFFFFFVLLSFVGIGKDLVALPSNRMGNEDLGLDLKGWPNFSLPGLFLRV